MLNELKNALNSVLLGKEDVVRTAICCMIANGHLLLEDLPGMGKTTLSHALAHFTGMDYRRIQFTSDLLPSDLIGVSVFDTTKNHFHFHKGPIFSQLILADEINRATPKTQSALLEAMEEHQVTTDEGTIALSNPFFVIATQNPYFQTGTYPLPESQLDRFLMRIGVGYPSAEAERHLLEHGSTSRLLLEKKSICTPKDMLDAQKKCQTVTVSPTIITYVYNLLALSRNNGLFIHGLSPRAGLAILRSAQAFAMTDERDFVRPEDVAAILPAVVNHRLVNDDANNATSPAEQLLERCEVPL